MNDKAKRARFRELAKQDRLRTARQLAEELEQPFLPLFNEFKAVVTRGEPRRRLPAHQAGAGGWRKEAKSTPFISALEILDFEN